MWFMDVGRWLIHLESIEFMGSLEEGGAEIQFRSGRTIELTVDEVTALKQKMTVMRVDPPAAEPGDDANGDGHA